MNLINKKLTFDRLKLGITVVSFGIAVLAKVLLAYYEAPKWQISVEEFCFVVGTGVFSAMILVWFIDDINRRLEEKGNKQEEARKIKQFDKILQLYLGRYYLFLYCITTPHRERNYEIARTKSSFLFKDMKDMFMPTGLASERMTDSSIECFIRAESALRDEIETMVRNIDYKYFPDTQNFLLDFVKASLKFNQKETWLNAFVTRRRKRVNDKIIDCRLCDEISDLFASGMVDSWYKDKSLSSRPTLSPYYALYEMINQEGEALDKYNQEIKKLNI